MRHHLEHFRSQLRSRAIALGGIRDLAGIGLRVSDEILDAVCSNFVGIHHKRIRHARHDDDGHELQRVKFKVRIKILIDDQRRRGRRQQRVAVGVGLGDEFGRYCRRRQCDLRRLPTAPICAKATRPGFAALRRRYRRPETAPQSSPLARDSPARAQS